MKQNGENYQWEYKCDDDRRNTRKREQQRRGIGVHWTFGFVQRPRFSATAPQYGSEAVGQWAGSRCLSVTTKTATALTRRVGEKWIGLLSEGGRWGVGCGGVSQVGEFCKKKFLNLIHRLMQCVHWITFILMAVFWNLSCPVMYRF